MIDTLASCFVPRSRWHSLRRQTLQWPARSNGNSAPSLQTSSELYVNLLLHISSFNFVEKYKFLWDPVSKDQINSAELEAHLLQQYREHHFQTCSLRRRARSDKAAEHSAASRKPFTKGSSGPWTTRVARFGMGSPALKNSPCPVTESTLTGNGCVATRLHTCSIVHAGAHAAAIRRIRLREICGG